MKKYKSFKFCLYPNKSQSHLINKTFGCCRFIWNKMFSDKQAYYTEYNEVLNITPASYKMDFAFLKEVDSLALCNEQLNLDKAYKNFFESRSEKPRFKSKHRDKKSYTTNFVNNNISLEPTRIKLPKLGYVRIKRHRDIPDGYKLKACTIEQVPSGKYFISILFEYESFVQPVKPVECLGLDFSMPELFVASSGERGGSPKFYRKSLVRLKREQRRLSKMIKYSRNYYRQKRKLAILHEKIANQRKDFLHKSSRQITNAYDLVSIEDLSMKGMSRALNFGKSVHDNGWGSFISFLAYKLGDAGKYLVKIDRWFPSSQLCLSCGSRQAMPLSERIYACSCGYVMDRDINAAINIRDEGIRLFLAS